MIHRITLTILILLIAACSSSPEEPSSSRTETAPQEPTNEQLFQTITGFLSAKGAPASSRYHFQRIDLDNDKRRDALVYMHGPYGYWCGTHGCPLFIFKAGSNTFTPVGGPVKPVRTPIYVSSLETKGWRNIIVRVSGRWKKSKNVALRYDGRQYPTDPSHLPAYSTSLVQNPSHTRVFNEYFE